MARTRPPFDAPAARPDLDQIARELRSDVVALGHLSKTTVPAAAFACIESLIALYWNVLRVEPDHAENPDRDRFIFNKESGITAYYAALARRGFFPVEELKQFNKEGCRLSRCPAPGSVPGVENALGLPGQGLGVAIGFALASRLQQRSNKTYVLLDAGELKENTIRDAARLAGSLGLDNLVAVLECGGPSDPRPLAQTAFWKDLGWDVETLPGNDTVGIACALRQGVAGHPRILIVDTTISAGAGYLPAWSERPPTAEELENLRQEPCP